MLDHQAGLFQTVKDINVAELRTNAMMLAKLATLMKIPVITTASEPNGPNGPLMPEIHESAPHAVYVGRKGEVNAWDNEDFVKTVRATGRKTLVLARSEEHTSELQSRQYLVCRLLLEKKKTKATTELLASNVTLLYESPHTPSSIVAVGYINYHTSYSFFTRLPYNFTLFVKTVPLHTE